jgi:hypothetical protein
MQRAKSNSLGEQGEEIAFSHMRDYGTQESIKFRKKSSGQFGRHCLGTVMLEILAYAWRYKSCVTKN